jgi:hypothetical protein
MATDPHNKWDVEDGHAEVVVCDGCGTTLEEFDVLECPECGEQFCSEACQDEHECLPQVGPPDE